MQGAPALKGLKGLRTEYPMKTAALLQPILISNQYCTEMVGFNKKQQCMWYLRTPVVFSIGFWCCYHINFTL